MHHRCLEIRATKSKGRGVFATAPIARGEVLAHMQGWLATTAQLDENWFALQVGPDLWLCSDGTSLDDCINHSCDPNAGFRDGQPILVALRDIDADEEIGWDYSTAMAEPNWSLVCRCSAPTCRRIIRPWPDLTPQLQERLRPHALAYLRNDRVKPAGR
ncbi:MAG: SET domain-containing protein [Gemmataceae bacterium]|nr:SET domain-containing protein [Gemmataceae bacterium]